MDTRKSLPPAKRKAPGDCRELLWQREKDSNPRRKRRGLRRDLNAVRLRIPSAADKAKEKAPGYCRELFMAAGEGFEPSHTESESAVLPLHNPAVSRRTKTIIQDLGGLSTVFFFRDGFYFCANRSAAVKYFFSGLYSRANTTTHRMMLGSM